MTVDEQTEQRVRETLQAHFPGIDRELLHFRSELLVVAAKTMANRLAADRARGDDLKEMKSAVESLKKAQDKLYGLEGFGTDALSSSARRIEMIDGLLSDDEEEYVRREELKNTPRAGDVFASEIKRIIEEIESATRPFDTPTRSGPKEKGDANTVVHILYSMFESEKGSAPPLPKTNRDTEEKSGQFLSLVKECFKVLKIDADPVSVIRKERKARSASIAAEE